MIVGRIVFGAMITVVAGLWLSAPVFAGHDSDHRGEVEKRHEDMVGSEAGSQAPALEDARAVELSHE